MPPVVSCRAFHRGTAAAFRCRRNFPLDVLGIDCGSGTSTRSGGNPRLGPRHSLRNLAGDALRICPPRCVLRPRLPAARFRCARPRRQTLPRIQVRTPRCGQRSLPSSCGINIAARFDDYVFRAAGDVKIAVCPSMQGSPESSRSPSRISCARRFGDADSSRTSRTARGTTGVLRCALPHCDLLYPRAGLRHVGSGLPANTNSSSPVPSPQQRESRGLPTQTQRVRCGPPCSPSPICGTAIGQRSFRRARTRVIAPRDENRKARSERRNVRVVSAQTGSAPFVAARHELRSSPSNLCQQFSSRTIRTQSSAPALIVARWRWMARSQRSGRLRNCERRHHHQRNPGEQRHEPGADESHVVVERKPIRRTNRHRGYRFRKLSRGYLRAGSRASG